MRVVYKKYKNAIVAALLLLVLITAATTVFFLKKSKDLSVALTLANKRILTDSLALSHYQLTERELVKVVSAYEKEGVIFNERSSIPSFIDTLLKVYSNRNHALREQFKDQVNSIRQLNRQIDKFQTEEIAAEAKLAQLNTDLAFQKRTLDSLSIALAKTKSELASSGLDSLTLHSNGVKIFFYGKTYSQIPNGFGIGFYEGRGYYIGEWSGNQRNGYGKHVYKDGSVYEGTFENDLRNGFGTYYYSSGEVYKGNWKNDLMDGKGEIISPNGKSVKGIWSAGKLKINE